MSNTITTVVLLAGGTYVLKAAGPLLLGGNRQPPPIMHRLALLLPAPLLGALVVTSTVIDSQQWVLDARIVGVAVAGIALWRRLPFVAVVLLAAAATSLTRLASSM